MEVCKTDVHRYGEKLSSAFPLPVKEQSCHFEPKKIWELEMKTRSKKAKKYSYIKNCKGQPREICDQYEKKNIQPWCDTQERLVCIYDGHRYWEEFSNILLFPVRKQNCYFEPKKIYELERKARHKKTKKFSYIKDCKEQPKLRYASQGEVCKIDVQRNCEKAPKYLHSPG